MKYVAIRTRRRARGQVEIGEELEDEPLGAPLLPEISVYESEDDRPEKTGLLDASGTPLYRVRERMKIGFHTKGD